MNVEIGMDLHFSSGTMLAHYEIIRPLGRGGMGEVYLARDTRLGRLVAIKFLLEHSGASADRFIAEARTTAQCRHENIVVIYDVGEYDGAPYMVLEYLEGQTLREVMDTRAKDMSMLAIEIMFAVVRALDCAHGMGIVHRDLKPENIFLANSGQIKVLDFGIAKQVSSPLAATLPVRASQVDSMAVTQDGMLMGTMPYMSPEQWLGQTIDARTDIWAAGIILFELFTGNHPLHPVTMSSLSQVADLDTPMPSARDMQSSGGRPIDMRMAGLIDRCLKKRMAERWASAKEVAAALEGMKTEKDEATSRTTSESPFAGLSAFQKSDADRFCGRDHDIAMALGKVRNQPLVVIAGPSGAGKSSFVRAGILPALERSWHDCEVFIVRPGRQPLAALADMFAFFQDSGAQSNAKDLDTVTETLRIQPGYLGAQLRARCRKRGDGRRIVVVVDQLEELYTQNISATERFSFCACMEGMADDASSPLRVIATIRADFLDRLAEDRRFWGEVNRGLFFLPPMTREGLREALVKPLRAERYQFEDESLLEEMLDGLEGTTTPLPILQFTATKLWDARDQNRRLLTREAYITLGGVAGALSTHADAVLSSLSSYEQRLAKTIFLALVTPERTRAIVRLDELVGFAPDGAAVEQVVHQLADARLVTMATVGDREGKTVELTHESLIERWSKFTTWLGENEQDTQLLMQLRHAALQWEKNDLGEGFLWRDRAARDAISWLERRKAEGAEGLGKREARYLEAVVALAERTRKWKVRIAAAVFVAVSVIAVVVSVLAIRVNAQAERANEQARRADEQAKQAQLEARQARNATRVAAARGRQSDDPTTALALLREIESGAVPTGWDELAGWANYANVASMVLVHDEPVSAIAFSPDGKRILSGSWDTFLRVWNADGTGMFRTLRSDDDTGRNARWSLEGTKILSTSWKNIVRVWEVDGSDKPLEFDGFGTTDKPMAFSVDGAKVAFASPDGTLRVWNVNGVGDPVVLRGHVGEISTVAFSRDGTHIASGGVDKTLRVWNTDGTGESRVFRGHVEGVAAIAFHPDGTRIVSVSGDRTARLWSLDGPGEPLVFRGHTHGIFSVAYRSDGKHFVTGGLDNTVRVWDAETGESLSVFQAHTAQITAVAYRPDNQLIATASYDKTARIWRAEGNRHVSVFRGHNHIVTSAEFSPDGKHVVSSSWDGTARIWNADGTGKPLILRAHDAEVSFASYSPDGTHVVTTSTDKTARIWNADGSGEPVILRGHDAVINSAVYSHDGQKILSASADKTARIWNADGSGEPVVLRGHEDALASAFYSSDGTRIVTASNDKTARIWNADGSGQPIVLRGHRGQVTRARFSPDGERIATVSNDKTIRIWIVNQGIESVVLRGHDDSVWSIAWSPDGKRLVSASQDRTVRVWNADGTGTALVLRGSALAYNTVAWSPDGNRVIASSDDKTVTIWDDLVPMTGPNDPRLWAATNYCMPLDTRLRLLGFTPEQSQLDLLHCQDKMREAHNE